MSDLHVERVQRPWLRATPSSYRRTYLLDVGQNWHEISPTGDEDQTETVTDDGRPPWMREAAALIAEGASWAFTTHGFRSRHSMTVLDHRGLCVATLDDRPVGKLWSVLAGHGAAEAIALLDRGARNGDYSGAARVVAKMDGKCLARFTQLPGRTLTANQEEWIAAVGAHAQIAVVTWG